MSEILQVVRIMATTTARGGGDSPPRHRPPPSLSQRASKTSRSLGRSSRALGHDRHGRWAVPRAAPPHGLSLAPDRRRSSGNNTRARIADRPSPCATRADWPTYRDGKRESAYLTLAPERMGTESGAGTSARPRTERGPRRESCPSGRDGVACFHPSARYQRQVRTLENADRPTYPDKSGPWSATKRPPPGVHPAHVS